MSLRKVALLTQWHCVRWLCSRSAAQCAVPAVSQRGRSRSGSGSTEQLRPPAVTARSGFGRPTPHLAVTARGGSVSPRGPFAAPLTAVPTRLLHVAHACAPTAPPHTPTHECKRSLPAPACQQPVGIGVPHCCAVPPEPPIPKPRSHLLHSVFPPIKYSGFGGAAAASASPWGWHGRGGGGGAVPILCHHSSKKWGH